MRGEHEKELLITTEGRVASIHSIAEKRNSRKLSFLLGKFSETELPVNKTLGNSGI